jgi:predicted MarR family transcription regulator
MRRAITMATNKIKENKSTGEITEIKTIQITTVYKVPANEDAAIRYAETQEKKLLERISKLPVDDVKVINSKRFMNLDNTKK